MQAWRIAKAEAISDFSGDGAALYGGRWNHPEYPALYLGLSPAACALDAVIIAGHLPALPLKLMHLQLPADPELYLEPPFAHLPAGWNSLPPDRPSMTFGSDWLARGEQLGLILPSATVENAHCVLINPKHPACARIEVLKVTDFELGRPVRTAPYR
ncbi:RES family NAD+ phosphorylase [Pseudomonas sp. Pseu.R1]|uniref:RES family NAD+ phosphorylase n=1 Tax=Pseudomonas sp. Pseu.R1 TaxID=3379818 RepID=UPI003B963D7A